MVKNRLCCDDNLEILATMEKESVDLTPEPATLLLIGLGSVLVLRKDTKRKG